MSATTNSLLGPLKFQKHRAKHLKDLKERWFAKGISAISYLRTAPKCFLIGSLEDVLKKVVKNCQNRVDAFTSTFADNYMQEFEKYLRKRFGPPPLTREEQQELSSAIEDEESECNQEDRQL